MTWWERCSWGGNLWYKFCPPSLKANQVHLIRHILDTLYIYIRRFAIFTGYELCVSWGNFQGSCAEVIHMKGAIRPYGFSGRSNSHNLAPGWLGLWKDYLSLVSCAVTAISYPFILILLSWYQSHVSSWVVVFVLDLMQTLQKRSLSFMIQINLSSSPSLRKAPKSLFTSSSMTMLHPRAMFCSNLTLWFFAMMLPIDRAWRMWSRIGGKRWSCASERKTEYLSCF